MMLEGKYNINPRGTGPLTRLLLLVCWEKALRTAISQSFGIKKGIDLHSCFSNGSRQHQDTEVQYREESLFVFSFFFFFCKFGVLMFWCMFNQTGAPGQAAEVNPVDATSLYLSASHQYCTMTPEALLPLCKLAQFFLLLLGFFCLFFMVCCKTHSEAPGRSSLGVSVISKHFPPGHGGGKYLDRTWSPTVEADRLCPQLFHKDSLIIPMVPKFLSDKFNMNEERSQNCQDMLCVSGCRLSAASLCGGGALSSSEKQPYQLTLTLTIGWRSEEHITGALQ